MYPKRPIGRSVPDARSNGVANPPASPRSAISCAAWRHARTVQTAVTLAIATKPSAIGTSS